MKARTLTLMATLIILSTSCEAAYDFYVMYSTLPVQRNTKAVLDTYATATDGFDGELVVSVPHGPRWVYMLPYKTPGVDGWNGPEGFYSCDSRAPLQPGQTLVINNIYLWAEPDAADPSIQFQQMAWFAQGGVTYTLSLVSIPDGVNYPGPREWGPGTSQIALPFYGTNDGRTGYKFRAEFTAIPEPSSLLALASGLAGLGGFVVKRKKS